MKILYIKYNSLRLDKFQIGTKIIKEYDNLYVVKFAQNPKAKEHLLNIYNNYDKLKPYYNLVKPLIKNEELYFDYMPYKTVYEQLLTYSKNDLNAFENLIDKYIDFINTLAKGGKKQFKPSKKFIKVFGQVNFNKAVDTISLANIDLIFDNIFLCDGQFIISDYEWVFDFEIPKDYIIARALVHFSKKCKIDIEKYLPSYKEFKKQFFSMEDNFNQYVFKSNIKDIEMFPKDLNNLEEINYKKEIINLQKQIAVLKNQLNSIQNERDAILKDYRKLEEIAQSMRIKNRLKNLIKKVIGAKK